MGQDIEVKKVELAASGTRTKITLEMAAATAEMLIKALNEGKLDALGITEVASRSVDGDPKRSVLWSDKSTKLDGPKR